VCIVLQRLQRAFSSVLLQQLSVTSTTAMLSLAEKFICATFKTRNKKQEKEIKNRKNIEKTKNIKRMKRIKT